MTNKRVLFILAPKEFRDEEFFEPKNVLDGGGVKVYTANLSGGYSKGFLGGRVEVNLKLGDVDVNDYDAVVFVGGPGCSIYFDNKAALSIAKESYLKGKILCAVCLATAIIANAELVVGKKVTGSSGSRDYVEKNKGIFTGNNVEVSGRIITASGPKAAKEFGEAILRAIRKNAKE